jgi:hypothetical protein
LLNVESGRFILALNSWVSFVVGVITSSVIVVAGGSLHCYSSANQQSQDWRSWEERNQMGE